jgi:hypothetical protein
VRRRRETLELRRWFSWSDAIPTALIDFALTGHWQHLTEGTTYRHVVVLLGMV